MSTGRTLLLKSALIIASGKVRIMPTFCCDNKRIAAVIPTVRARDEKRCSVAPSVFHRIGAVSGEKHNIIDPYAIVLDVWKCCPGLGQRRLAHQKESDLAAPALSSAHAHS